jgi:YgiT-type zinc finger domain-containing protein
MGLGSKEEEIREMRCRICGSKLIATITALPFKVTGKTIVILKQLPVMQCDRCSEYSIEDSVFARVEELLRKADVSAELEIISFAA